MANNVIEMDKGYISDFDKKFAMNSQVWDVLRSGQSQINDSDFVGVDTVLINKMSGFNTTEYKRNEDNEVTPIKIEKEAVKLTHQDWASYQIDDLDTSENLAATVQNALEEHRRLLVPKQFDNVAVDAMINKNGKTVTDTIDSKNVLAAYDEAEAFMLDHEVGDNFVMFVSSGLYQALKNSATVSRTFTTNTQQINGIDRRVSLIDGSVPIIPVSASHGGNKFGFILTPTSAVSPIIKYSNITYVPSQYDTRGNRSTVKYTNFYDAIVLDNQKDAIYVANPTSSEPAPDTSAQTKPTAAK